MSNQTLAFSTSARLLSLQQGPRSIAEYSVEFWSLASDAQWNEEVLRGVFICGFNESVKDELAALDERST